MRTHRDEKTDAPLVLAKWYDWTKWILERLDSFPKNQRFIFGQRLADRADAGADAADPYGLADDPLAFGPFCWILRAPKPLAQPIPCPGRQVLWDVPEGFLGGR